MESSKGIFSSPLNLRTGIVVALLGNTAFPLYANSIALPKTAPEQIIQPEIMVLNTLEVSGMSAAERDADLPYMTSGSSNYISAERIEQRRGTSVGDFLKGTPGVLNSDNRNSGALDVNIRGMQGQGRVPIIVDGASQETTIYRGYSGIAGRTYIDPDLISSATIEKGASTSPDANGAIGGVVRMSTLNVNDIVLPNQKFGVRMIGSFNNNSSTPPEVGTRGGYPRSDIYRDSEIHKAFGKSEGMDRHGGFRPTGGGGSLAVGARTKYLDVVAAFARRQNGNYYAGKRGKNIPQIEIMPIPSKGMTYARTERLTPYRASEEILNTSMDNISYLLKGKLKFDENHTVELAKNEYISRYGEIMPSSIARFGMPYEGYMNKITVSSNTAQYHLKPAGNYLVDLKANAFFNRAVSRINTSTPLGGKVSVGRNYSQSDKWGVGIHNTSEILIPYGDLSFTYGAAYSYEKIGFPKDVIYDNWTDTPYRDGWRNEYNAIANVEWRPVEWLAFEGGLRYSYFKSHDNNPKFPEFDFDTGRMNSHHVTYGEALERTGSGWSPIINMTLEPVEGLQFYGKYGSAIRLPSLFETTKGWSQSTNKNILLSPERSLSWEVGINVLQNDLLLGGDKLRTKLSYFDNHIKDYLTRVGSVKANGRDFERSMINIDKAEFRGLELSTSYDMGILYSEFSWSYFTHTNFCLTPEQSYKDPARRCHPGGVPDSYVVNHIQPKQSYSVTLGGRAFDKDLDMGAMLNYIGSRPSVGLGDKNKRVGSTLVHVEWKPYTTIDLFMKYQINKNVKLHMGIDNVTDVYYLDPLAMGLMPGPGRTFRTNLTVKF
ncbi:TonB receptor-related protein [Xenorhabdus mauleonii]|uniref:Hemoglobin/transferrin/lactoferrin receptor protein n=1 Tax=Xenorhabdus mauleonii TaxID=351675 RepID=A0A1I3WLZ7_9GAMM|nr:TonB-dependent receptor [Xenorhabdus mauleonii]PHM39049.1 TonB receptor-related protein [Xenorhabdus mauleonii]SFK07481.1 hemoglobin/transferrin/lactoferrin receptor protein [Xenorhabdus mauleonii]